MDLIVATEACVVHCAFFELDNYSLFKPMNRLCAPWSAQQQSFIVSAAVFVICIFGKDPILYCSEMSLALLLTLNRHFMHAIRRIKTQGLICELTQNLQVYETWKQFHFYLYNLLFKCLQLCRIISVFFRNQDLHKNLNEVLWTFARPKKGSSLKIKSLL